MPELPEVETTVQYLRERTLNLQISAVKVRWARSIHCPKLPAFRNSLKEKHIAHVSRRGKYIVIHLSGDSEGSWYLLVHLRMSGSIDVVSKDSPRSKHDQVTISLSDGREIRFHDPRKFGRVYLVRDPNQITGKLGLEPLEETFTPELFFKLLLSRKTAVKTFLLDQTRLAGVGNIYADEALWAAGIHPRYRTYRINRKRSDSLFHSIRKVLSEAIVAKGTDNGDGVVDFGLYEPKVYGRAGEKCHRCKSSIRKMVLSQRGTSYCPRCQRAPRHP